MFMLIYDATAIDKYFERWEERFEFNADGDFYEK